MTRIKICGISNLDDALLSVDYGADALGFIFCESPRQINIEKAKEIIPLIPPYVNKVAVIKDFTVDQINEIITELSIDTLQFHGNESEEFCLQFKNKTLVKVIHIDSEHSLEKIKEYPNLPFLHLDTLSKLGGGSGKAFNWDLTKKVVDKKIILAGGLNPDNISEAIRTVKPYAVDVSSGVEKSKGIKDPNKLKRFIDLAKSA